MIDRVRGAGRLRRRAQREVDVDRGRRVAGRCEAPANAGAAGDVTAGPVRGSLHALNHAPVAGKGWPYTVKVTDPAGKPIPGTVEIEFLFAGQVVGHDTPPTHPLRHGTWRSILTFPRQADRAAVDLPGDGAHAAGARSRSIGPLRSGVENFSSGGVDFAACRLS